MTAGSVLRIILCISGAGRGMVVLSSEWLSLMIVEVVIDAGAMTAVGALWVGFTSPLHISPRCRHLLQGRSSEHLVFA